MAASYVLDLEPLKKHVFVTQLEEEDREAEQSLVKIPIVSQKRELLIHQGVNTLQKTLLLKKKAELVAVHRELDEKRKAFKARIDNCHRKEKELLRKQAMISERINKSSKFVADNDAKRRNAMAKFQQEQKHKERKILEIQELNKESDALITRLSGLHKKIVSLSKYRHFLERSLRLLPEGSSASRATSLSELVEQYERLSFTNATLMERLSRHSTETDQGQKQLKTLINDRKNDSLVYSQKIASTQFQLDSLVNRTAELEEHIIDAMHNHRTEGETTGRIKLAIQNLFDKCNVKNHNQDEMCEMWNYSQKLDHIKRFMLEQERVIALVRNSQRSLSFPIQQQSPRASGGNRQTDNIPQYDSTICL